MQKKLTKILILCSLLLLLNGAVVMAQDSSAREEPAPNAAVIVIDGKELVTDTAPYIVNNLTMAPMRAIFEALGATVEWSDAERSVTAVQGDKSVLLYIGSATAYINQKAVALEVIPFIDEVTGRTMVPLRLISEGLGCTVKWDAASRTVSIVTAAAKKETATPLGSYQYVAGSPSSDLDTIHIKNFDDGDVLRYSMSGDEVDRYVVLYDYSEDAVHPGYPTIRATLKRITGSLLVIEPAGNSTDNTLRIDEDTVFFDASDDQAGAHKPLTKAEFASFKSDPIIIWTERGIENRGYEDVARLVIRVRR